MQKKTNEQFLYELFRINPNILTLESYKGSNIKMMVKCKLCNHEWAVTPNSLLNGSGCPICNKDKTYEVTRKKQQTFLEEMQTKNPSVEVLGEYISNKQHIKVKCKHCGTIWEAMPCHLIRGHGCPNCANEKRRESAKRNLRMRRDK